MQKFFKRKAVGGDETLAQMQARKKLAKKGKSSETLVEEVLSGYR